MAKKSTDSDTAKRLVSTARTKARKLVVDARAKAKRLIAAAQAKAKALLAKARAQAKSKAEKAKARKAVTSRTSKKKPTREPVYQTRETHARAKAEAWRKRQETMTATEIKRTHPRIPVEQVLRAINSFYASPGFTGPVFIGAIRSHTALLGKHEVDYQLTELARVGLIRLLRSEDVRKLGIEPDFTARSKGYPWAAPEYLAVEKVG